MRQRPRIGLPSGFEDRRSDRRLRPPDQLSDVAALSSKDLAKEQAKGNIRVFLEATRLLDLFELGREVVKGGGWPEWSPMVMVNEPGSKFCKSVGADYCFANSRYQILVIFEHADGWPPLVHLSIKAHDKRCVHDWRDLQRIKNEIVGPEAEGVELYPAESRLMDEANQFHLYCTHPVIKFPFGQKERTRCTQEELDKENQHLQPQHRPRQRAFEDHHGSEGCLAQGLIEWPSWALEQLERSGFGVEEVHQPHSSEPPDREK